MLDAICHEFIRVIGDWRLAIGDCDWAQKLCAIRWADSLRLRLCPIGGQHLLHGFRDLVIRSSCKLDCSPCAICHEFIRMLVSSDWAQIVATTAVPNRGPASVARLYEVGGNSTVHRVHEFTFDQFTVRILRLVHFLFSLIFANLLNYGISSGFVSPIFTKHSPRRNLACVAFLAWRFCREHVDPIQSYCRLH